MGHALRRNADAEQRSKRPIT